MKKNVRGKTVETRRFSGASKKDDERVLLERARAGDSRAFEMLMRRYEDQIYSLAYRMMGDKDEAFDVLQEATINAYQHLSLIHI